MKLNTQNEEWITAPIIIRIILPVCFLYTTCSKDHQSVVCLTTSPESLPKQAVHRVQTSASLFNCNKEILTKI